MTFADLYMRLFARQRMAARQAEDTGIPAKAGFTLSAPPEKAERVFVNPLEEFWNLDIRKNAAQAAVTVGFFMSVAAAMDFIIIIPFRDNPAANEMLADAMRFPPSLFVGSALCVIVALARRMSFQARGLAVCAAAGMGLIVGGVTALLPLFVLLQMPCKKEDDEPAADEDEPTQSSLTLSDDPMSSFMKKD